MTTKPVLLVVDDEPIVRLSCKTIFEREGFDVEATESPKDGLRLAAERRFSGILLDIMMPEMNGLEFLERLRGFNATVPVIIITGYASVTSAAEAMRLHASDYVSKPFTPAEIIGAVRKVLSLPTAEGEAATPGMPEWDSEGGFLFLDQAWLQRGRDGSVLVGAFLSRDDGRMVEAVHVPPPGSRVQEGLPLAEVMLAGGRRLVIPSPVTGEVAKTNRSFAEDPRGAWDDPCRKAWLARIRPDADGATTLAGPRRVVLAASDEARAEALRKRLGQLGCEVHLVRTAAEVPSPLRATGARMLLIDALSLDAAVPGLLDATAEAAPEVKTVVVARAGWAHEATCRKRKLSYYAVEPFGDEELIGLLDAAFRPAFAALPPARTGTLPDAVRVVRITNRNGAAVALLAPDGVLLENSGVGQVLLQGLRELAFPARLTLGSERLSSMDIWQLAQDCHRGLLLMPQDAGRVPGSLIREELRSPWTPPSVAEDKVATFVVQAAPTGSPLAFDPRTNESLARLILSRMASVQP